jgi:3-isopropylmalate/(R)-2-methylmalate dehydratase small subunit
MSAVMKPATHSTAAADALVRKGRVWKLGDDVASDLLISANHVFEYDPRLLRKHLLHDLRPELAGEAREGDVLVAGRRFAHGSQHSHPFLAMKEMGLGLLAVKPTRAPFRLAIYMGVPLLEISQEIYAQIADGETLEADFVQGRIALPDSGREFNTPPLPPFLLDIVRAGGGLGYMREQAAAAIPPAATPAAPAPLTQS